jgi:hypothetical protein
MVPFFYVLRLSKEKICSLFSLNINRFSIPSIDNLRVAKLVSPDTFSHSNIRIYFIRFKWTWFFFNDLKTT